MTKKYILEPVLFYLKKDFSSIFLEYFTQVSLILHKIRICTFGSSAVQVGCRQEQNKRLY